MNTKLSCNVSRILLDGVILVRDQGVSYYVLYLMGFLCSQRVPKHVSHDSCFDSILLVFEVHYHGVFKMGPHLQAHYIDPSCFLLPRDPVASAVKTHCLYLVHCLYMYVLYKLT